MGGFACCLALEIFMEMTEACFKEKMPGESYKMGFARHFLRFKTMVPVKLFS